MKHVIKLTDVVKASIMLVKNKYLSSKITCFISRIKHLSIYYMNEGFSKLFIELRYAECNLSYESSE